MSYQDSYLGLARLLCYPEAKEGLLENCDCVASHFKENGLGSPSAPFEALLRDLTLSGLQEEYVAVFDFNPKGSLYLGYHLQGDNQKRSAFMIGLKQEFARHAFAPAGNELPDHLAVLLSFLAHLVQHGEGDYRRRFIAERVLPGLGKMGATATASRPPAWQSLIDAAEALCNADSKEVRHAE
jgi:nitrate reductase molybdenum cofactor assembly chaperone NarJ/NarW